MDDLELLRQAVRLSAGIDPDEHVIAGCRRSMRS